MGRNMLVETMQRPIEHCYWVSPGSLLAGEYPRTPDERESRQKIGALIGAGVSAFIDLTEATEGLLPYAQFLDEHKDREITHQRFPIEDVSTPAPRLAAAVLDAIDGHLLTGRIVYVHCWGGVGRTGVIVGCWLSRHGYHGEAALARLDELWQKCPKSAHKPSPETDSQRQFITNWTEPSFALLWSCVNLGRLPDCGAHKETRHANPGSGGH